MVNTNKRKEPAIYGLYSEPGVYHYIGSTSQNSRTRLWEHIYRARNNHSAPVYQWANAHLALCPHHPAHRKRPLLRRPDDYHTWLGAHHIRLGKLCRGSAAKLWDWRLAVRNRVRNFRCEIRTHWLLGAICCRHHRAFHHGKGARERQQRLSGCQLLDFDVDR